MNDFISREPKSAAYFFPYIGGEEFIDGTTRYLLCLSDVPPEQIKSMPKVLEVVDSVRQFRLGKIIGKNGRSIKEGSTDGQKLANTPTKFHVSRFPKNHFLVVPETSSERRDYVPIGWLKPPTIPSSLVRIIENAAPFIFGLLTSRMHMAWLSFIGGRLKSDYRYSIGLVYNPFPWPDLGEADKEKLDLLAKAILSARASYPQSALADLYDPLTMPPDLRKAHHGVDLAVDRLYRKEPFASDRERVEFLLARYETITAPALALASQKKPKRRKTRKG